MGSVIGRVPVGFTADVSVSTVLRDTVAISWR